MTPFQDATPRANTNHECMALAIGSAILHAARRVQLAETQDAQIVAAARLKRLCNASEIVMVECGVDLGGGPGRKPPL